jgi:hypothetical protein
MSSKAESKDRRPTTLVPVTTMEELPVLSAEEQAKLRAELEAAEARIAAGGGVDYDRATFRQRLIDAYRASKR